MKRRLSTVLSLLMLLGVGSAAAALNVRMLHTPSAHDNRLTLQATSNLMMSDVTAQPTPGDDAEVPTVVTSTKSTLSAKSQASPTPDTQPTMPATGTTAEPVVPPVPVPPTTEFVVPSVQPVNADGEPSKQRPAPMSLAQMNLLRIAAMAGVTPEVARAVARGDHEVDSSVATQVKEAAALVGVSLDRIASVDLPKSRERAEGRGQFQSGEKADD